MGQMPQMDSDQMQMLQNLHQMKQEAGRKQKEQVRIETFLHDIIMCYFAPIMRAPSPHSMRAGPTDQAALFMSV